MEKIGERERGTENLRRSDAQQLYKAFRVKNPFRHHENFFHEKKKIKIQHDIDKKLIKIDKKN